MPIAQPNAILGIGGLKATGVLDLEPGAGFHVRVKGGAVGSLWAETRVTGGLSSDYSQLRVTRAGVPKWRMGNNLAGNGADDFFLRRDAEGGLSDLDVMKVTRTTGRVDFAGDVYAAGVLLGSGGTNASALSTGTVPVLRLGASGTRDTTTFLRGDNTWAVPPGGGGGSGMPTTGGSFTGAVYWRNPTNTKNTIALHQEGRIILDAEAAGASTGAPSIQFRVPTEDSPFETFYAQLSITGDRGIRFNYNYREPYVGGLSHGRSDQFQILTGMEQDGAWFIRYEKPYTIAAGTYDVGGKSLAIYPGGFTQGVGPSTTQALQTVDIVGMQAGRSLRFGASTTAANPIFAMAIGSDGNVQTYNRLGIAASTADRAGIRINAGVDVTAGSAADGDLWCTATDFKCKVGGVVKTFTLT